MNIAAILLPHRIIEALGWTLFHSLWQGALAALGFAAVLYFSRRYSARVRYGLGLATLALVLLMSGLTFWNHYSGSGPAGSAALVSQAATASASTQPAALAAPAAAAGEESRSQRIVAFFSDYFSRHLPLIVSLWLLGVLFLTLRFSGSLLYIQRLKYWQNRPLPSPWPEKLQELAARAGLRRPLRLLESLRLKTPVVIGHLKPVLLLPAGLVTGLPADEVEALLAHELAHILRRDYLVNVMQHLVDILFFFHPGLRWISAAVRQEREHCCDDFAVELCGDARHYALALARLQAAGAGTPQPALAAAGRAHKLLRRIARLLGKPRLVHDFREGFVSALLLVVCLFGMLKLAGAAAPVASATEVKPKPVPAVKSQAAGRFELISFDLLTNAPVKLSGKVPAGNSGPTGAWIVDDRDGQIVWYMSLAPGAQAGGAPFSDEVFLKRGSYTLYMPAGCAGSMELNGALSLRESRSLRPQEKKLRQDEERKYREESRLKAEQMRLEEEKKKQLQELAARTETEQEMKQQELKEHQQELRAKSEAMQALKEKERQAYEAEKLRKEEQMQASLEKQSLLDHEQQLRAEEKRLQAEEQRMKAQEKMFQQFIQELIDSGLVSEAQGYEIKLSAAALVINGKKQPAAVHEKFQKFYETLTARKLDDKRTVTIIHDKD